MTDDERVLLFIADLEKREKNLMNVIEEFKNGKAYRHLSIGKRASDITYFEGQLHAFRIMLSVFKDMWL